MKLDDQSQMDSTRNATLDLIRVTGMLFVMFIHSPLEADIQTSPAMFFLKHFIARGAVPVFFLLSGYLGARRINSSSCSAKSFIKGKLETLVVPFLFWNSFVLLLVFLAKYAGLDSIARGNGTYFDVELSASSIGCALFGIGRYPIVYQFWFLRDLIVVTFVAFALCRYAPKVPLLPWLLFFVPLPMASSLGYYLLGHQLNANLPPDRFPDVRPSCLYCGCWFLMGIAILVGSIQIPFPLQQLGSSAFIFMLAIILSWNSFTRRLSVLGPGVFFVYATHEPLQTILAKGWQAFHLPAYGTLFCFLLIPGVVFATCMSAYFVIRRVFPRSMALVTGGRSRSNKAVARTSSNT